MRRYARCTACGADFSTPDPSGTAAARWSARCPTCRLGRHDRQTRASAQRKADERRAMRGPGRLVSGHMGVDS